MVDVKPIRTEADYEAALEAVEREMRRAWSERRLVRGPDGAMRWASPESSRLDSVVPPLALAAEELIPAAGGGPVFVTVAYQVQPGAEEDFQQAVRPLGWSRRRTGAVSWAVLQHAESPGRFVEMFAIPSWDEYLRQQTRRTVADAALDDRLRAFLSAGTEPDVEHFLTTPKPHHHDPGKD